MRSPCGCNGKVLDSTNAGLRLAEPARLLWGGRKETGRGGGLLRRLLLVAHRLVVCLRFVHYSGVVAAVVDGVWTLLLMVL